MSIKYFDRRSKEIKIEKVYGSDAIDWLYSSITGHMLSGLVTNQYVSWLYGLYQNTPFSKFKIDQFIQDYDIDMSQFLPHKERTPLAPYGSFNEFFIRRFKQGARNFMDSTSTMPAFCEGRYYGASEVREDDLFPVKGKFLNSELLLENRKWSEKFEGGPILIARLCPVDYHRFHFPDNGQILERYNVSGDYHSVNPAALKKKNDIFCTNKRTVTILETEQFGTLAYIEVGALMVGRIVQTHHATHFYKGDEKGYFLFGGSTVIVLGVKKAWVPSRDILEYSSKGIETFVELGKPVAER